MIPARIPKRQKTEKMNWERENYNNIIITGTGIMDGKLEAREGKVDSA